MKITIDVPDEEVVEVLRVLRKAAAEQHRLADGYPMHSQDPNTRRYAVKSLWSLVVDQLRQARDDLERLPR